MKVPDDVKDQIRIIARLLEMMRTNRDPDTGDLVAISAQAPAALDTMYCQLGKLTFRWLKDEVKR